MILIKKWSKEIHIKVNIMRTSTFNHKYFKYILNKDMITVDMTMGNGNDTFFLANHSKYVYAFDIQEEAMINTKKRCKDFDNIEYILDDHQNIKNYVHDKLDVVMFNLGFLPGSDSKLHSTPSSTIKAIEASYDLLNDGGYLSLMIYRGHEGGLKEYYEINKLIKDNNYHIIEKYLSYTSLVEPILYIIRK